MRVLIVDDERPIREWIAMCLKKINLPVEIVGSAANGKEAYEIFCEKPLDVIITDIRMPVMDGLELMRRIKQRTEKISFIILTCHEEFSYAREALKLGTEDYLLKTEIDQEQLEKIFLKISRTRKKYGSEENVFLERQAFIYSVLQGNLVPDGDAFRKLGIYEEDKDYFITMIKGIGENQVNQDQRELKTKDYSCVYFFYEKDIVLILVWTRRMYSQAAQLQKLTEFAGDMLGLWGGTVGVSRIYSETEDFLKAYREASAQLEKGFYKGKKSVNLELLQPSQTEAVEASQCGTEEMVKQIYRLSRAELGEKFMDWLDGIGESGSMKSDALKEECIFVLNRMKDKYSSLNVDRNRILQAESFGELRSVIADLIMDLWNLEDKRMAGYVREAVQYIEENYSQSCKLETVAKHVGLNPDYLSRLFKSNTNQTFNAYLTEVRMEAAKRMLVESDMTIGEVAERTGYQNIAYFSRVFKKYTGITPFDYKK